MGVTVNCWYCSKDSQVPRHQANSWECPSCDQYNGFTSDGDLNIPLSASRGQTHVRYNVNVQRSVPPTAQLCQRCSLNQSLKIRQIAEFRPIQESSYDSELEQFVQHLDRVYDLCALCRGVVDRTLREKEEQVRPSWLAWKMKQASKTLTNGVVSLTQTTGSVDRTWLAKGQSFFHWSLVACRTVCLSMLLYLLIVDSLYDTLKEIVPDQQRVTLAAVRDPDQEIRGPLALICFALWVLTCKHCSDLGTLLMFTVWVYYVVVGVASGKHVPVERASVLQLGLVLTLFSAPFWEKLWHRVILHRVSGVQKSPSSPGKTASKPAASLFSAATDFKAQRSLASPAPDLGQMGLSGCTPRSLPEGGVVRRSQQVEDYSLTSLSLGSPKKRAGPGSVASGAGSVFSLRTYCPPAPSSPGPFTRPLLSPARLRGDIHHSSWIAGGFWQRGQPAPDTADPLSRSSSQSSGFVDGFSVPPAASGPSSVCGDDRSDSPTGYYQLQRSPLSLPPPPDTYVSAQTHHTYPPSRPLSPNPAVSPGYPASQLANPGYPPSQLSPGYPRRDLDASSQLSYTSHNQLTPPGYQRHLDASSQLSLSGRSSLLSMSQTEGSASSILHLLAANRAVIVAMVLGFSVAFNLFAVLVLVFKDKL